MSRRDFVSDQVRVREREPGVGKLPGYRVCTERSRQNVLRGMTGKIVVREEEREWELGPMGNIKNIIYEGQFDDTALGDWWVFINDIRIQSGKHRHQGGLIIFVLEGSGYSIVEGEREDWEAGDLLLLPLVAGGVEHQHFSKDPSKPTKWCAFIYVPLWDALLSNNRLLEDSPGWKAAGMPSLAGTTTMMSAPID
jgi:hypothetical protein